ncbi:hypothetical protein C8Q79DRAFT_1007334 [Trametes meyenii]|nr:hypothetical protein C8Q79DRAFT_1007334 [Trametes meyenii]
MSARSENDNNLQKGERFVNINYLFNSTLQQNTPSKVTASYDIACHLDRKLNNRFASYGYDLTAHEITWAIPKFHINAHREQCRADYNLHFLPESAQVDGEGVERSWGKSNRAAGITKEMGPGSRADFLDDIFADHNWQKICALRALLAKIKKAVPERDTQVLAFEELTASLPSMETERWRIAVEAWEADASQPNPFLINRPVVSQASVKRQLMEDDARALQEGSAEVLHEKLSASGMIIAGIELEELQLRVKSDHSTLHVHVTDLQRARQQERQNQLRRKIDAWAEIQQLYMPMVASHRAALMAAPGTLALAHNIPLLLPSTVHPTISCPPFFLKCEWQLRYAQAHDALADLRGHLEVRLHMYQFKDRFARGQRQNTRTGSIVKHINGKLHLDAERYRVAQRSLYMLSGKLHKTGWQEHLRVLLDSDIRHISEGKDGQSEGHRELSWI